MIRSTSPRSAGGSGAPAPVRAASAAPSRTAAADAPAAVPHDLTAITRGLVPELQRRGAFRTAYDSTTLRGHLGLTRPVSRYATAG
ncbi:Nitrilotriacetate monooxygenase component A [Streptomyces sp. enrichment culture]